MPQVTQRDILLATKLAGIMKEASANIEKEALSPRSLIAGAVGLPILGGLGVMAAQSNAVRQQGEVPYYRTATERWQDELQNEYDQRMENVQNKVDDYLSRFIEQPDGGFVDSVTGGIYSRGAIDKRIGYMKRKAEEQEKKWLSKEYKKRTKRVFDPNTGMYKAPEIRGTHQNLADVDLEEFKKKMYEDRGFLNQLVGDPFIHRGSVYFGGANPYRNLLGGRSIFSGPQGQENLRKYWRSKQTGVMPVDEPTGMSY